jgi:hypothetical protein
MGINVRIFEGIRDNTYEYGFERWIVEEFLTVARDFPTRQANAISIIEGIMTPHGKQKLLGHVVQLAKVEYGIRELEPLVRDHVVHALLSFLVGVFVHEHLLKPGGHKVSAFQWKLAGLFHDVGYPAQVAKDILKSYTDQINRIKRDLSVARPDVFFRLVPVGLDELTNGVNSLCLMQEWLGRWRLKIDAKEEYVGMVTSGVICHGMISSLSVLYVVDLMYQKYNPRRAYVDIDEPEGINWNQSYFENDIVPACAAIFVHNLPERCFRSARLDRSHAALPFLLRLSDCLQVWDRPSASDPVGISDNAFDIEAAPEKLLFTVADPVLRTKIAREIASTLLATDIEVI